jgi:hypothetical protein
MNKYQKNDVDLDDINYDTWRAQVQFLNTQVFC